MAPEMIENEDGSYDSKVDIWALGITCIGNHGYRGTETKELGEMNPPHWKEIPMRVLMQLTLR